MSDELRRVLAGDIGGTKTVLALFDTERGPREPITQAKYASGDYDSLGDIVAAFLVDKDFDLTHAAFGVAGPVSNGRAEITNLPWIVDADRLSRRLDGTLVGLLNDLESIAYGVPFLAEDECYTLNAGTPAPHGNIAVIAPGTGLGEAFLTWAGDNYQAHASEGGHTDFAPRTERQVGLLRYLQKRFGHVSYERVCSGSGIPNIYAYLKDSGYAEEPAWLAEKLAAVDDIAPIVTNVDLDEETACAICEATLEVFVSILGAEAGNLALKLLATGGVYLGGGIPPKIMPALRGPAFREAFRAKGRFSDFMAQIPIHVINNPELPLIGAACYGLTDDFA